MADTTDQSTQPVTRLEIIEAVEHQFVSVSPNKQELMTAAIQQDSRGAVLELLSTLPERQFKHVRDLWDYLPDVPLGD